LDRGVYRVPLLAASLVLVAMTALTGSCTQYWHFVAVQGLGTGVCPKDTVNYGLSSSRRTSGKLRRHIWTHDRHRCAMVPRATCTRPWLSGNRQLYRWRDPPNFLQIHGCPYRVSSSSLAFHPRVLIRAQVRMDDAINCAYTAGRTWDLKSSPADATCSQGIHR
jgi:hypothetical protein